MDYENDTSWVRGMLQPGENLLWTGRPEKLRLLGKEDFYLIPFSLFWCGFAGFATWMVWKDGSAPLAPRLFMLPFILAGLWLLAGRFIVKSVSVKKQRYALTSRRIIIRKGRKATSLDLGSLPPMSVLRRDDGSGDIRFNDGTAYYRAYNGPGWNTGTRSHTVFPELLALPDVDRVEYRIRQAVEHLRSTQNV